jgi:hypothetical protein
MRKAVNERLAKSKLSTTPYHIKRARDEFTFIDPTFHPAGKADKDEYEGGAPDNSDLADAATSKGPNAIRLRITIPSGYQPPLLSTPAQILPNSTTSRGPILGDTCNTLNPSVRINSSTTLKISI